MILKSFSLFFRCSSWWSLIYLTKSIHNTTKGVKQQSTWDNFIISCGALLGVSQVVLVVHSCGFCLQGTCSLARLGNPSYRGDAASAICTEAASPFKLYASLRPVWTHETLLKLKSPEIITKFIVYKRRQDKICWDKTKSPYSKSQTFCVCVTNKIVCQG